MKRSIFITLLLAPIGLVALGQDGPIFPKGEKAANVHHVGNVWLTELSAPDSSFAYSTAQAVFDPGARLNWHQHPGGQILMITAGVGFYQEKGKAKQTVRRGRCH